LARYQQSLQFAETIERGAIVRQPITDPYSTKLWGTDPAGDAAREGANRPGALASRSLDGAGSKRSATPCNAEL
jgi:hypothetical protein